MRRHQQQKILELLKTIEEAQNEKLYAQCQECALAVGEYIESIAGEGTQTVTLLEEYCDLLFNVHNGEQNIKALHKYNVLIENSVKTELKPDRIEVLFLPHQPSRWDSLESIYLEAREDPDCDAYVVPVPYYELNPDESIDYSKEHYDGAAFPDGIPVTHYSDYDIEERRPDIIFKDYPFDDNTSTFSIHPDYYSKRLRGFCRLLIWVPYFVICDENLPEFYAYLPGATYAHYVIVQSEMIRQKYIKHFTESDKKFGWDGYFGKGKDKFIALGSPKFDKVINSKPEDYKLPSQWERLLYKPCGTKKKAVFFNTHTFAWLAGGAQYFDKVRRVFEVFKNRNDAVLWWRPHPYTEINLKANSRQHRDLYAELVNTYKSEGWGIYDDTPDLHRAIACTDAYYGDVSSLVIMYRATGKPVMIQEISNMNNDIEFDPSPFLMLGDDLWFMPRQINALMKMNKETLIPEYVGSFSGEPGVVEYSFHYVRPVEKDGVIYFPPYLAEGIATYTIENSEFGKIEYDKYGFGDSRDYTWRFGGAIVNDDNVFFIPRSHPAIVKLDTKTGEVSYFSDWYNKADAEYPMCSPHIVIDNTIWFASGETNAVVEFNMDTCESVVYKVGEKDYRYGGICFDGKNFWLSPVHNTPVIKWNQKTEETEEFPLANTNDKILQYQFISCIYCGGFVWLLPYYAEHAMKIDTVTDEISIATEFETLLPSDVTVSSPMPTIRYTTIQAVDECIYAFCKADKIIYIYNTVTKEMKKAAVKYTNEVQEQLRAIIAKSFPVMNKGAKHIWDLYYREHGVHSLDCFLTYLTDYALTAEDAKRKENKQEIMSESIPFSDGTSGKEIYGFVKKELSY